MTRALWSGSCRSRWAVPLAAVEVVAGVVMFLTPMWWTGFVLIAGAMLIVMFRHIDVEIGRRDLSIRYGAPWSWPQRVARKDIESVRVVDVVPLKWGGWGYRGSLRLFRRAAVILRGGPALELNLRGRRRLLVTVDDAAGAVAVLESRGANRRH